MKLFKKLTAPVQAKLLEKHMCPACTRNLDRSTRRQPLTNDTELVECQCGRKFHHTKSHHRYRRQIEQE